MRNPYVFNIKDVGYTLHEASGRAVQYLLAAGGYATSIYDEPQPSSNIDMAMKRAIKQIVDFTELLQN